MSAPPLAADAPLVRGHASIFLWGVVGLLLLKVPLVLVAVAHPDGVDGLVPETTIGTGLYLTLGFLGSSIVLVALRWWIGALSALTYCVFSLVGGLLMTPDVAWWGAAIALTSAGALTCLVLSIRHRDYAVTPHRPGPRRPEPHRHESEMHR